MKDSCIFAIYYFYSICATFPIFSDMIIMLKVWGFVPPPPLFVTGPFHSSIISNLSWGHKPGQAKYQLKERESNITKLEAKFSVLWWPPASLSHLTIIINQQSVSGSIVRGLRVSAGVNTHHLCVIQGLTTDLSDDIIVMCSDCLQSWVSA